MCLSSIGDGGVHNGGGGSFGIVGFTTGLILPYSEIVFFGPASFITPADKLLRVRMIYYACVCFITRADTDMTKCYVKRLYLCFEKLIRVYKY